MSKVYYKRIGDKFARFIHHKDGETTTIPPLTTTVNYTTLNSKNFQCHNLTEQDKKELEIMKDKELISFSWRDKNNISKPFQQETCGSCWAVAVSTALNDHISISANKSGIKMNPNLGPSYILSNYRQNGCNGGNPADALSDIFTRGIMSEHCIDYSWYNNQGQGGGGGSEFKNKSNENPLNSIIPKANSCYLSKKDKVKYKGLIWENKNYNTLDVEDVNCNINHIKAHLHSHGPLVTTFKVYTDFMYGLPKLKKDINYMDDGSVTHNEWDFDEDGIYICNIWDKDIAEHNNVVGGHAVVVVGWGRKEVDYPTGYSKQYYKNHKQEILGRDYNGVEMDYWECRNSWGTRWGDKGYFKVPMSGGKNSYFLNGDDKVYFNQLTGFDCVTNDFMGGFLLFEYDFNKDGSQICIDDSSDIEIIESNELIRSEDFYNKDQISCPITEGVYKRDESSKEEENKKEIFKSSIKDLIKKHKNKIYIGIFILLIVVVIVLIVLVVKK